jgi:hypothetical protein
MLPGMTADLRSVAPRWCHWGALACEIAGSMLVFLETRRILAQLSAIDASYAGGAPPAYTGWYYDAGGFGFGLLLAGIILTGVALALDSHARGTTGGAHVNRPVPPSPELTTELTKYREFLIEAERKSQEDFDKTVLSLSGGALGISFIFLKDVIGSAPVYDTAFLLGSWVSWGLSSTLVLASFYVSDLSLRKAIKQVDAGTIYESRAGGWLSILTTALNPAGAILFFVGICLITIFAGANLSTKDAANAERKAAVTAPETHSTPSRSAPEAHSRQPGSPH